MDGLKLIPPLSQAGYPRFPMFAKNIIYELFTLINTIFPKCEDLGISLLVSQCPPVIRSLTTYSIIPFERYFISGC
jgi:hypothetical protein